MLKKAFSFCILTDKVLTSVQPSNQGTNHIYESTLLKAQSNLLGVLHQDLISMQKFGNTIFQSIALIVTFFPLFAIGYKKDSQIKMYVFQCSEFQVQDLLSTCPVDVLVQRPHFSWLCLSYSVLDLNLSILFSQSACARVLNFKNYKQGYSEEL